MTASATRAVPADRPITRGDLESKFRELKVDIDGTVSSARTALVALGAAVAVGALAAAFLLGRRAGRRRTTVVEVRRF